MGNRLTEAQRRERSILAILADVDEDFSFLTFKSLMRRTGLDRATIRRDVRRLARKGMAQYGRGLMTEDGDLTGAGYAITPAGRAALVQEGGGDGK